MKNILLALLFLIFSSTAQSANIDRSCFNVIKPIVVKKKQVAPLVIKKIQPLRHIAGYHEHECPYDGTRWGHGSNSFGNGNEHRCPKCGRLVWNVAPGIKLR